MVALGAARFTAHPPGVNVRWVAAVVLGMAMAVGCGGRLDAAGSPCAVDGDCGGGLRCVQDAPLSECPAGAACGAASCESRCRAVCDQSAECPGAMGCARRWAIEEQSTDCDLVIGAFVQVCAPDGDSALPASSAAREPAAELQEVCFSTQNR